MKRRPLSHRIRPSVQTTWPVWLAALWLALTMAPVQAQNTGDPLVLAFYYAWFDESTWSPDKLSDLPAEPYVSRDRSVMGRQIDQAKAAGIDALLVAWYGPGDSNQTETNLAAMLDEAGARGFRVGVLFETTSPFFGGTGDVIAALQHLLSVHANHPAYLRAGGRPVVFFWRPTVYSVDTWRSIRNQVDPGNASIWIAEGVDTGYLSVFDGHHLYSNTWNPPADLAATNAKFASLVDQARQSTGVHKLWVATVMPGYNDTRIRAGGFARDREGGAYFARSWQAAIAGSPDWVVINSFNEWPEGTYIEPSAAFGDQYIALSATYSAQFKSANSGRVAVSVAAPAGSPQVQPTPTPAPSAPTAYVDSILVNLRAGPGLDYEIAGQVAAGAALPILGRHPAYPDWWQVRGDGGPLWIYAPLVTAAGPLDQVEVLSEAAVPAVSGTDLVAAASVGISADRSPEPPVAAPLLDPGFNSIRPALAR